MKKYITLFSLIALFFIGIQQNQAQELEKKSLGDVENEKNAKVEHYNNLADEEKRQDPKHKAKVASLEMQEANSEFNKQLLEMNEALKLTPEQEHAMQKHFMYSKEKLDEIDNDVIGNDEKSKKADDARAVIIEERDLKIMKLLSEDQMNIYNEYKEKIK